jgi:hypothetical protein
MVHKNLILLLDQIDRSDSVPYDDFIAIGLSSKLAQSNNLASKNKGCSNNSCDSKSNNENCYNTGCKDAKNSACTNKGCKQ